MATFTDDFNRADGSLGSEWTAPYGSPTITSHKAYAVNAAALLVNLTGSEIHDVTVRCTDNTEGGMWSGFAYVKASSDGYSGYYGVEADSFQHRYCRIYRRDSGTDTLLADQDVQSIPKGTRDIQLIYDAGDLTLKINGTTRATAHDTTHDANTRLGIAQYNLSPGIEYFSATTSLAQSITVSPDPLWVGGGDQAVTINGTNTSWTVGVPGSSTITVDHGTISDQRTVSATEIRLTYTPAEYVGTITFTESEYGASDTVDGTVVAPEGQGGGTTLSQDVIDWLEAQAAQGGLVLADSMENTEAGATFDLKTMLFDLHLGAYKDTATINNQAAASALLYLLYRNLSGYTPIAEPVFDLPTTDTPVKVDTEQTLQRLKDLTAVPAGDLTLSAMVDLLGGDPFASHHTLLEAIQATDSQAVLDAIAALQGAEGATVDGAIQLIQALSTVAGYDLSTVRDWVEAVRGTGQPDLAAVMTKLGQVQPSTAYTLSSVNTQNVDLKQLLDTLALVIGIVAPEAGTVAELIALIYDAVTTAAPAAANVGPPVWIDEEHATIDSPIALSDGLIIEGPLDGVLVTITGSPSGATKFTFGETDSWRYVGAVIFETDRGDAEWSQPIGLEAQIITPRTMQHASAARFRVSSGWSGTVSAFTVTAGA